MMNTGKIWSTVGTIIGGALALIVIAALLPTYFPALADVNNYLNDPATTTGDSVADGLLTVFPIVIGILGLLTVVGWAMGAFNMKGTSFGAGRRGGGRSRFSRR